MGFKKLLSTCLFVLGVISAFAQVTTSGMNGVVKDSQGEGLPGATVKATHLPSGTIYGTTTQPDGRYNIPNMRAGGPYKVEVTFIGYTGQTFNDVNLKLGVATTLNATLASGSQQLQEVSISGSRGGIINPNNSGTGVSISRQQIENLPTVTRSVQDFARLSAQATTYSSGSDGSPLGISFGGQNNRYNQFAIDGAMANDVFGLSASGTNGGQASANPISIEAIDQIQVVLNPYDVKQSGFAGGGINAITKSGTNDFHGAAYFLNQNQGLVGKSPDALKAKYGKFNSNIYGFGLGGPIIRNKLFFYINAEQTKRTSPVDFNPEDPGTGVTSFTVAEMKAIHDFVQTNYNVDLGGYTKQEKTRDALNILGRIDWNINNVHRLTIRHAYTDGEDVGGTSRSRTSAYFYNSYFSFPSKTNSTTVELNSAFSNRMSNELRVGYNIVRDRRKYLGDPFPSVSISDAGRTFNIGSEFSSTVNGLAQNVLTIVDNLTLYRGKHTITVGTSNDFYKMQNDFIQNNFGAYSYDSISGFLNNLKPRQYQIQYTAADTLAREGIQFSAAQVSLYAQDVWDVLPNFRLTVGLRVDMPIFPTDNPDNTNFSKDPLFAGYSTAKLPKSKPLWAPRLGFNWDVFDNGKTQVRGGVGIFTSRLPFVWISNQYNNTGVLYTTVNLANAALPAAVRFRYDKNDPFLDQYSAANLAALGANIAARPANVNLTDVNFKFPQTFKTNIAIDQQLPWGVIGTLELNFSKTINNAIWTQLNTELTGSTITLGGTDTRPTWRPRSAAYDQVLLLTNTNKGYTYNASVEFTKSTSNGLFAKVGYSFGEAKSLNDGTNSTAGSNWRFNPNINGLNDPEFGYSKYRMGHRVLGVVSKTFRYGKDKKWATTASLFYNGQSGTPFTWVYFNTVDPTGDDRGSSGNNDLLYIPTETEVSTMRFDVITSRDPITNTVTYTRTEAEQRADLNELIANDKYLSERRGQRAERYGARSPFEHVFDFKLAQILPIVKAHKIELTFDVMNIGNLLSSKWGRTYFIGNNVATPITFRSVTGGVPFFQYDKRRLNNNDGDFNAYFINNFTSRWRGQLGVRYSF